MYFENLILNEFKTVSRFKHFGAVFYIKRTNFNLVLNIITIIFKPYNYCCKIFFMIEFKKHYYVLSNEHNIKTVKTKSIVF